MTHFQINRPNDHDLLNSNHFLHPLVLGLLLLEPEITSAGSVFTIGTAEDANEEQQCVNVRNKILDPTRKDAIQTNEIEYLDNDTLKAINVYLPVGRGS